MKTLFPTCWILALSGALNASAAECCQSRGSSRQGVSSTKGLPTTWSSDQNILWKTATPGPGGSSPVVLGGYIYVTCYGGYAVPDSPGGDIVSGPSRNATRHVLRIRTGGGHRDMQQTTLVLWVTIALWAAGFLLLARLRRFRDSKAPALASAVTVIIPAQRGSQSPHAAALAGGAIGEAARDHRGG